MNIDENRKLQEDDENSQWLPFEQYQDQNNSKNSFPATKWTLGYLTELICLSFPGQKQQSSKERDNNKKYRDYCICTEDAKELCDKVNHMVGSGSYFTQDESKKYWDKLLYASQKKKALNKRKTIWNHGYLSVLLLNRNTNTQETYEKSQELTLNDKIPFSNDIENGQVCDITLASDSESEESEEVAAVSDPMYNRFGVIRSTFHTSEDGVVFYSQKELIRYKAKMSEMKSLLQSELEQIKDQHAQLRAKKSEERKLLSEGINNSHDHDLNEDEPTEKDALNSENSRQGTSKQERKSAIFSSIHDAFSYARTGIQGIFVKTSPNISRKVRTNDDDSSESDDEDTPTRDLNLSNKNSAPLLDNHDEFTRQMTSEGGLKYKSSDKSVQQLSYQNLPPPLSLSTLPDDATTKS